MNTKNIIQKSNFKVARVIKILKMSFISSKIFKITKKERVWIDYTI